MKIFTLINQKPLKAFFITAVCSLSLNAQCDNFTQGGNIEIDPDGTSIISINDDHNQATIALGANAPAINTLSDASGGNGTAEYIWMVTTTPTSNPPNSGGTTWTTIGGATGKSYDPGNLYNTTYFVRCARRDNCTAYVDSRIVVIKVDPNALPVELINFEAKRENNNVVLNWTTASERNHAFFTIEHSTDGENFATIETIKGNGINSDDVKYYTFTDRNAQFGQNYYRLHQEDNNGTVNKSEVVAVKVKTDTKLNISPNPVLDWATIRVANLSDDAQVLKMLNLQNGQVVRTIQLDAAQSNYKIDTQDLPAGLYAAQILSRNGKRIAKVKFMKAN